MINYTRKKKTRYDFYSGYWSVYGLCLCQMNSEQLVTYMLNDMCQMIMYHILFTGHFIMKLDIYKSKHY